MSSAPPPAGDESQPGACPADSGLEVRLFGTLEVLAGGQPLPRLRSRKGQWLLALLALRAGRDVDRGWLAGTLWPESEDADGRRSLRQSLHDLRLALGPEAHRLVCAAPRTLRLDVPPASVDALAFDAAAARADPDSLEAAVRLYRGPLLEDCYEEWCLEERRPRQQAYLAALAALAAAATTRGEHPAAADYLRLAVETDPYREDLHRALMQALAQGGSPAAAIEVYRQYRALLWREMAAEPAAETTALFRRLRDEARTAATSSVRRPPSSVTSERSDPTAGSHLPTPNAQQLARTGPTPPERSTLHPPRSTTLPLSLTELIGRDEEIREVITRISHTRLVTLTGTGGIGKTRLALRVAEEISGDLPDGICLVELAALSDPGLVPQVVAAALEINEEPGRPLVQTLVDALQPKQLLLVLDNCEHLLAACAALADALLSRCAGVRILATSRQALGVRGETVWRVPSLAVPANGHLASASQYPAVRLFAERARAAEASFEMTPHTIRAVAEVCRRLDGIPLAIELAAARVSAMAVEQIAQRLDDRFRLLTHGSRTALPRHQTLRAAMDWSYELLTEAEQTLLRRLSVFAGGWTLEAAEAIADHSDCGLRIADCGLKERVSPNPQSAFPIPQSGNPQSAIRNPQWEVLDLLTRLVDQSLVGVELREGAARYALLETTREYAGERLREAGEEEALRLRHAEFFLALAERAEPELHGPAQSKWFQQLEAEHDNFRAALDWPGKYEGARTGRSMDASQKDESPRTPKARRLTPNADLHPSSFILLPLQLATALGPFWWMRGYFSEGRERLQAVLARSGYDFGSTEPGGGFRVARPPRNALHPERCPTELRRAQVKALYYAGMLADDQGDYDAARALFQECLALSREVGDPPGTARALNGLGALARHAGDGPAARALYEESLAIWREVGDRWWTAASLTNLGGVALLEGEEANARGLVESALEIQRQVGDRRAIARSLALLGRIAARLGDHESAQALLQESLTLVRELGARMPIEETLQARAQVALDRGDHDTARACYEERLAIAREIGSGWGTGDSLYYLGLLASDRGESGRAGSLWSESLGIFQTLGDKERIAACLERLAILAAMPGQAEGGSSASPMSCEEAERAP